MSAFMQMKGGGIITDGSILAQTLTAGLLASEYVICNNATALSGMSSGNKPIQVRKDITDGVKNVEPATANATKSQMESLSSAFDYGVLPYGAFTGYGIKALGFFYPNSSYYKTESFYMAMPSWQALLSEGRVWTEPVVRTPTDDADTRPFPGEESWKNKSFMRTLKVTGEGNDKYAFVQNVGALEDSYVTNLP
jgi:hypothetical protein